MAQFSKKFPAGKIYAFAVAAFVLLGGVVSIVFFAKFDIIGL